MSNAGVRTYDPKKYTVVWGGWSIPMSAFPEGTFIKVVRSEKKLFEKKRAVDGSIERNHKNVFDFTIDFEILQTDSANDILSAAVTLDQESGVGAPPIIIKDAGGTSVFTSGACWISQDADLEAATTLTPRKWQFETGPGVKNVGGNISLLSAISSLLS